MNDMPRRYGPYGHVTLTLEQIHNLSADFDNDFIGEMIWEVDKEVERTGKSYNDYCAAIREHGQAVLKKRAEAQKIMRPIVLTEKLREQIAYCIDAILYAVPKSEDDFVIFIHPTNETAYGTQMPNEEFDKHDFTEVPIWRGAVKPASKEDFWKSIENNIHLWNQAVRKEN